MATEIDKELLSPKRRVIGFDLDGTLAVGNVWEDLNALAGITVQEDQKWLKQFTDGEIDHRSWMDMLSTRYRAAGTKKTQYEDLLREKAAESILPAAKSLISQLQDRNEEICIVSGGVDLYVSDVAKRLGIKNWYANYRFEFEEDGTFKDIQFYDDEIDAKVNYLTKLGQELNIPLSDMVFVGDSYNDLEAFRQVGKGIYIQRDGGVQELVESSWRQVKSLEEVGSYIL